MIYWLAKLLQATGLVILLIRFMMKFPALMDYKSLTIGLLIFLSGWLIEAKLLKK